MQDSKVALEQRGRAQGTSDLFLSSRVLQVDELLLQYVNRNTTVVFQVNQLQERLIKSIGLRLNGLQ